MLSSNRDAHFTNFFGEYFIQHQPLLVGYSGILFVKGEYQNLRCDLLIWLLYWFDCLNALTNLQTIRDARLHFKIIPWRSWLKVFVWGAVYAYLFYRSFLWAYLHVEFEGPTLLNSHVPLRVTGIYDHDSIYNNSSHFVWQSQSAASIVLQQWSVLTSSCFFNF